jgi:ankyrin repeat domain-containing protein 50
LTSAFASSTIIQDVIDQCRSDPSLATACFYFDFHDSTKQRGESLLCSLITQFADWCESTPEALEMLYSQNQDGRWRPTDKALLATLLNILQQFQNAYIIIDALDECTE